MKRCTKGDALLLATLAAGGVLYKAEKGRGWVLRTKDNIHVPFPGAYRAGPYKSRVDYDLWRHQQVTKLIFQGWLILHSAMSDSSAAPVGDRAYLTPERVAIAASLDRYGYETMDDIRVTRTQFGNPKRRKHANTEG